jgi:hypothetical protein
MLAVVAAQEAADIASGHGLALAPVIGAETLDGFAAGVLLSAGAFVLLLAQRNGLMHLRWAGAALRRRVGTMPFASEVLGRYPGGETPERRWLGRASGAGLDAGEEPLLQPGVRLREWLQGEPAATSMASAVSTTHAVTTTSTTSTASGLDLARTALELDLDLAPAVRRPDAPRDVWDERAERFMQALEEQQAAIGTNPGTEVKPSTRATGPAGLTGSAEPIEFIEPAGTTQHTESAGNIAQADDNAPANESLSAAAAAADTSAAPASDPTSEATHPEPRATDITSPDDARQPADEPARHGRTSGYKSKHRRPAPERPAPWRPAPERSAPDDDQAPDDGATKGTDPKGKAAGLWPEKSAKSEKKESRRRAQRASRNARNARNPRHAAQTSALVSARNTIVGAVHIRLMGAHR